MEGNINETAIENYAQAFSEKIMLKHATSPTFDGKSILHLTPIAQVNYFILKRLFEQWKLEVSNIKSPYFNFDAPPVQELLQKLMNTLSKNIRLDKKSLRPLLYYAVNRSILLIISPYQYYLEELKRAVENDNLDQLQENLKFHKVNAHFLSAIIEQLKIQPNLAKEQVNDFLDEICAQISNPPEDIEPFLQQFNAFEPIQASDFFEEVEEVAEEVVEKEVKQEIIEEQPAQKKKVYEQFSEQKPKTLHEQFSENNESQHTLADKLKKQPISDLKKSISINQRFRYTNELFDGDKVLFNDVIEKLEIAASYEDAVKFLKRNYAQKYNWDYSNEDVTEFFDLLARKYAQ